MQNFRVVLWFKEISSLVLLLLIFIFCSWQFYKILIYFQFHISIPICDVIVSNLILIYLIFIFLGFFC
jgi:hypothetical protein